MISDEAMSAKVAVLSAYVSAVAKEYGLDASARLFKPMKSGVSAGEPSVEVVVVKRTAGGPLQDGKAVTVSRYEQVGNSIFERFIREEAAPKLNRS